MISLLIPTDGAERPEATYTKARWARLMPEAEWCEGLNTDVPFNRSAALNAAAAQASGSTFVTLDRDCFAPDLPVMALKVERFPDHWRMNAMIWRLSQRSTTSLLRSGPRRPWPVVRPTACEGRPYKAKGGIIVVPAEMWADVQGFDERFQGWGSEDTAFMRALATFHGDPHRWGHTYHLWHPRIGKGTGKRWEGQTDEHQSMRQHLRALYTGAAGNPEAMRAVIEGR